MARRPTQRRQFELLTAQWEPRLRSAFLDAVADISGRAELGRIIERLERGDLTGAIEAVHLDSAAFRTLERAKLGAFEAGGVETINRLPALRDPTGGRVVVRFDMRAPRVEQYLRHESAGMVTRLVGEQQANVRQALERGMAAGQNPRQTALDLIGRIDKSTGRRVGGTIGLSGPQAQAVSRAREGLASGTKTGMQHYLGLTRRDKRFDATVLKAISEGRTLDQATINRIMGRYSDRLLQLRGETIARTETLSALARSREEAFRQAVDTGAVKAEQVTKVWIATKDNRTRDSHAALNGEKVALNQPFSNGLMYPHADGAPPEEVVNCRCTYEHMIDFLADLE